MCQICFTWSTYPSQKAFKQGLPLQVKNKRNCREEILTNYMIRSLTRWRIECHPPEATIQQKRNALGTAVSRQWHCILYGITFCTALHREWHCIWNCKTSRIVMLRGALCIGYWDRIPHFDPDKGTKPYKNSIFLYLPGKKRPLDSQSLCDNNFERKILRDEPCE